MPAPSALTRAEPTALAMPTSPATTFLKPARPRARLERASLGPFIGAALAATPRAAFEQAPLAESRRLDEGPPPCDSRLAMRQGPIFVVGTGRSGTTLLRFMLCAHPRIYITHE